MRELGPLARNSYVHGGECEKPKSSMLKRIKKHREIANGYEMVNGYRIMEIARRPGATMSITSSTSLSTTGWVKVVSRRVRIAREGGDQTLCPDSPAN
jgi:hypothetical protein